MSRTISADAFSEPAAIHGRIGARLYPFRLASQQHIDVYEYAVIYQYAAIQALRVGLGILLGAYLMSWLADCSGRRVTVLLVTALGGICLWPYAYLTNFWGLVGIRQPRAIL